LQAIINGKARSLESNMGASNATCIYVVVVLVGRGFITIS
jgi:hypothetical protein